MVKYPCKIFQIPVAVNHDSVKCDRCDMRAHTKYNKITKQTYKLLHKDKFSWYYVICTNEFLPFSNFSDEEFISKVGKKIPFTIVRENYEPESNL